MGENEPLRKVSVFHFSVYAVLCFFSTAAGLFTQPVQDSSPDASCARPASGFFSLLSTGTWLLPFPEQAHLPGLGALGLFFLEATRALASRFGWRPSGNHTTARCPTSLLPCGCSSVCAGCCVAFGAENSPCLKTIIPVGQGQVEEVEASPPDRKHKEVPCTDFQTSACLGWEV